MKLSTICIWIGMILIIGGSFMIMDNNEQDRIDRCTAAGGQIVVTVGMEYKCVGSLNIIYDLINSEE